MPSHAHLLTYYLLDYDPPLNGAQTSLSILLDADQVEMLYYSSTCSADGVAKLVYRCGQAYTY